MHGFRTLYTKVAATFTRQNKSMVLRVLKLLIESPHWGDNKKDYVSNQYWLWELLAAIIQ